MYPSYALNVVVFYGISLELDLGEGKTYHR